MYSILLKTRPKPGSREAFLSAMRTNAAASVRDEPGWLPVLRCPARPQRRESGLALRGLCRRSGAGCAHADGALPGQSATGRAPDRRAGGHRGGRRAAESGALTLATGAGALGPGGVITDGYPEVAGQRRKTRDPNTACNKMPAAQSGGHSYHLPLTTFKRLSHANLIGTSQLSLLPERRSVR